MWFVNLASFGDSILSTITPNGTGGEYTEYNHPDRLGTRLITNQTLGTSYEQAHLPFGKALNAESTITNNNKRFTSYDRSAPTGLDYAVNRTYDSKQGRFTQVDPIGMGASSLAAPQTLNLYTYCGNDPVNHTDPSGLFWGSLFKWIGRIIKAIMIAVAVIIAVAVLFFAPDGFSKILAANLLVFAASLIVSALAPPKIGAIIGLASGIVLSGPGIIVNFARTVTSLPMWQKILASSNFVGSIANSFAGKPKKRPGRFQTVDQAAIFWLKIWNPYSINNNIEVAVSICEIKKTGELIFGNDDWGTSSSSTVRDCPSGSIQVGSAHTHGAYDQNYDNENFSTNPGDRVNANTRSLRAGGGVPNYVATPSGVIKKFKPSAISGSARGKVITFKSKTPIP